MYWSLHSIPELSHLSKRERKLVYLQAFWYGFSRPRALLASTVLTGLALCGLALALLYPPGLLIFVLVWPVLVLAGGYLTRIVVMNEARPRMKEIAAERVDNTEAEP